MRRRACWCRRRGSRKSRRSRRSVADGVVVGDPAAEKTGVGPVVSKLQFERVEGYIAKGIAEGAKLIAGGAGRPEGLSKGYYVQARRYSRASTTK